MESADRIEALGDALHGLSARMLLSGALDDNGVKDAYEKVVAKFASLADAPTPPVEQSGLAGELQTLAINVNADIPDEGTRNRYVSALLAAVTALTADKARDEALEEVRRLEDENRDLRREQIALVEAAGGELKVPHEVLNDLPSLELIKCRSPEDMTVRYKTRSLKGAAK